MFRPRLLPWLLLIAACTPDVPTAPADPEQLTLVSSPPTGTPGWVLDAPLTVKVTDAGGRPAAGVVVTWQAESGAGQLESDRPLPPERPWSLLHPGWTSSSTTISDENGIARVRYAPGWESGTQRVSVTAGDATLAVLVAVTSFSATSVALGSTRACGLDPAGRMYCWQPAWRERQLIPTTMPASMRPIPTAGSERYLVLAGGNQFRDVDVCGLTTDHQLRCAFLGSADASGVITMQPVATPVPFVALTGSGVGSLAGQSWLCGLDATGQAWCRGRNDAGQLGDGTRVSRTDFAPVLGSVRFSTLVASEERACGVDLSGGAWCWGSGPARGIGLPSGDVTMVPTAIAVGRGYREVTPVSFGVCGIRTLTNQMECWGNAVIQLAGISGGGFGQDPTNPRLVSANPLLRAMSGSAGSSGQFLTTTGQVANWGDQVPFDLGISADPEYGAGLTGFDRILTQGTGAICSSHVSGSTVCSWVYYRGVGVPVPN
ncbi:MAG: Ig-like domain-containing protein [Gemmatimonadota bacterium]